MPRIQFIVILFLLQITSIYSQDNKKIILEQDNSFMFNLRKNLEKAEEIKLKTEFTDVNKVLCVFESDFPLDIDASNNKNNITIVGNKYFLYLTILKKVKLTVSHKDFTDCRVEYSLGEDLKPETVYYFDVVPNIKILLEKELRKENESPNWGGYFGGAAQTSKKTNGLLTIKLPEQKPDLQIKFGNANNIVGEPYRKDNTIIYGLNYPNSHTLIISSPGFEKREIKIENNKENESFYLFLSVPPIKGNKIDTVYRTIDKTEFELYSKITNGGYDNFLTQTAYLFEDILNNNKNRNNIKFDLEIEFDSKGKNNSFLKNFENIEKNEESILSNQIPLIKKTPLNKAAKETLKFKFNWKYDTVYFKKTFDGSVLKTDNKGKEYLDDYEGYDDLVSILINDDQEEGIYGFEILNKDVTFNEKKLNFKEINYLENSYRIPFSNKDLLYGALLPGYLNLKSNKSSKIGWIKSVAFGSAIFMSLSSKLYSGIQYNKYLSASDRTLSDKYYKSANSGQRFALLSGGIAFSIYAVDTFFSVKRLLKLKKHRPSDALNPIPQKIDLLKK
jgi:hypothetical protein